VSRTALILGARNLGRAVAGHLAERDWAVAAVAQSDDTISKLPAAIHGIALDASTPQGVDEAVRRTRERFGPPTLLANAVAAGPSPSGAPFGGGPLADLSPEDFEHYALRVARQTYAFLSAGVRALRESGGGTLIQITGGSTRRAIPGRGAWAAGSFATRALTNATALELRDEGIHAALLIVDAVIRSPKTAAYTQDAGEHELAEQEDVARAVEYLANQGPTSWTHELQVTPRGDRWVP
jgi:NAD(P)-dependent dehydrogenase (short-subunit alcohol dehydrogenase family)